MPRPLRIEYEGAYYHVMSRGRRGKPVFRGDAYYNAFLKTLDEAHQRFKLQILCYCLMGNHYHLLVKTPEANLGRVMRHINGLYTQRYNRLRKTDGPLFRGRYKAILVEEDSYQLQLSRYFHRNPIEAGLVARLEDYPWSSYPSYVKKAPVPGWLYREDIYRQLLAKKRLAERYRTFVKSGVDEEIAAFYGKGNQRPCLGSEAFRNWAYRQRQTDESELDRKTLQSFRPGLDQVIDTVAERFKVDVASITISRRGRVEENVPRWVAMHLAQEMCGLTLREIADYFGLKRAGSISTTIAKLKARIAGDKRLTKKVNGIKREYYT